MDRSLSTPGRAVVVAVAIAVAIVTGLSVGAMWLLAEAPALVSFGIAVAAAFSWCFWLEAHSGASNSRPVPSPDGGRSLGLPAAPLAPVVSKEREPQRIRAA
jgi:hypothetical protein